jgi:hypothetical protein
MLFIVLMAIYGDKEVENPMKVLYFVNHNSAVNDFALDAEKTLVEMGKEDAVVRLHGFEQEVVDPYSTYFHTSQQGRHRLGRQ